MKRRVLVALLALAVVLLVFSVVHKEVGLLLDSMEKWRQKLLNSVELSRDAMGSMLPLEGLFKVRIRSLQLMEEQEHTYNGKPRKNVVIVDTGEIPKHRWDEEISRFCFLATPCCCCKSSRSLWFLRAKATPPHCSCKPC
ncbi:unnamed protein product [Musa hybrid cultivar]